MASEMGMVERVARALYARRFPEHDPDWQVALGDDVITLVPAWQVECEADARAAIEATRKPTREMIRAGHKAMAADCDSDWGTGWEPAITAALSEKP